MTEFASPVMGGSERQNFVTVGLRLPERNARANGTKVF